MAGVEIDSVHLALSGPHIKGFNSRGVIAVAGKNREITREDVRRAIDAAKAVSLPTGREILHVPQTSSSTNRMASAPGRHDGRAVWK
jgi:cell division protein FtsA